MCLIGIAHLQEGHRDIKFSRRFEIRPFRQLNLSPTIQEEIGERPPKIDKILMNLFHAVKLVCSKTLAHCPISGNIHLAHNGMIMNYQTSAEDAQKAENLNASQFAYQAEEMFSQNSAAC